MKKKWIAIMMAAAMAVSCAAPHVVLAEEALEVPEESDDAEVLDEDPDIVDEDDLLDEDDVEEDTEDTGDAEVEEEQSVEESDDVELVLEEGDTGDLTEVILDDDTVTDENGDTAATDATGTAGTQATNTVFMTDEQMAAVESYLNLRNMEPEWSYSSDSDSWTLTPVVDVVYPKLPRYQGVSVCVPGPYVIGIDTDGDGGADVVEGTAIGDLVIDHEASITSSNGQVYTAATAPVIVNTGAAGYSEQANQSAPGTWAAEGYINMTCGNRGKQSAYTNKAGDTVYTGDAPSCLVDQKNAVRFIKYNILLGNLPGNIHYFVSTGGSGGGAHAAMLAATSDSNRFFDYEAEDGAVGIYKVGEDSYVTSVLIDGEEIGLTDGVWGTIAYSPITSLAEADMAQAFEYTLDPDYEFNTEFQKKLAAILSESYMDYINTKKLTVNEEKLGFDLDGNGSDTDTVPLTIEYDEENGYSGTYLDLYLAVARKSLRSYLSRLDYADDWTWFVQSGGAMSDEAVAAMTTEEKAEAFIHGCYAKGASEGRGMGRGGDGMGPGGDGQGPDGQRPDGNGGPGGEGDNGPPDMNGEMPSGEAGGAAEEVGTPDAGTTQSAASKTDSANYADFDEMLAAYKTDIEEIEAGDRFGNSIVDLYDPVFLIPENLPGEPSWVRILMGASEGDISMFNSLNMMIAWLDAGVDCEIEWQWDGGHVPSEILGDSFALYVDQMYGKYVDGAVEIKKPEAEKQTKNGTAEEATGTDISSWVEYDGSIDGTSFSLADFASYRGRSANKAVPGFDVIDYGQEDYVFGSESYDARHWDRYVLDAMTEHADELKGLFNS